MGFSLKMSIEQYEAHQRAVKELVPLEERAARRGKAESGDMQVAKPAIACSQQAPSKPPNEFDGFSVSRKLEKRSKRVWKPKLTETSVMQTCYELLMAHPAVGLVWRQNTGAARVGERYIKFSFKGASDLMAILQGGKFMAVECKATGKKPTAEQQAFLDNVNGCGGIGLWCDDPAALQKALDGQQPAAEREQRRTD